jgi:photosystem II stability/assembly factor-like uncharacterized protein
MKIILFSLALSFFLPIVLFSQVPSWHVLPNAPTATYRYEDTYFANANTGWIININGQVYKTSDGGHNWDILINNLDVGLRSTGFFDAQTGIIGTLDTSHILFRTTNGGINWIEVTNISNPKPKGLCGISIVNGTTAYACGRYTCPANVIKSTDAGITWTSLPVDTSLARALVDCYFWSADSGLVVGGYSLFNQLSTMNSVILTTTNGGISWSRVYISSRINEICWKINFISRLTGYASISPISSGNNIYYLKTTNGGLSWQDQFFMHDYDVEGIGFVNESTGWIGGYGTSGTGPTYETTDAGSSWHTAGWGFNINRFRFLSDTLAYAVGKTVYKYTREPIGIQPISNDVPEHFSLEQNYPNPFNPNTKFKIEIAKSSNVKLIVYDV